MISMLTVSVGCDAHVTPSLTSLRIHINFPIKVLNVLWSFVFYHPSRTQPDELRASVQPSVTARVIAMNGAMKLLLVFVAACCTPTAFGEEVRTSKWSYVFTALSKSPTADNAEQANNALVSAIGGSLLTCNPGWTGQFCESPICSSKGTVTPPNQSIYGQLVDMVSLPKCAGSFQFPYDSLSDFAYINVQSDGGAPVVVLTDSNGTIVGSVEATGDETQYHVFYRKLLPGTYSVSVRLTIGQANYCAVDVNAYSDVSIRTGFVSPAQNDFPPDDRHGNADERSYFVAHAFNLPYPGGLSTVIITEDGSDAYRAVLGKRYACVYENFAGWFTCKAGSTYMAKLDGIDYNGNPLRRSLTFRCLLGTTTQAPITTSPPPISQCLNGGTLLYAGTPDAYCYCPVLFTGRSCENALCMNGGSRNQLGTACICLEGFTGPNCQNVNCTFTDNIGLLTDQTSLVFVVRASTSMAANIPQIAAAAQAVIDSYNDRGANVFRTYVLVSFVNGAVQVQNFLTSGDSWRFISALTNLANNLQPGADCKDNVMDAVSSTFESFILTKSPIFVFTDAYANDYQAFFGIFNRNANIKFPIYFITITPTPESGCVNEPLYPGNRAMQDVARYTQALSMAVDSTSPNLRNLIQGVLLGTTNGMNPVYSNDMQQCSRQPTFQAFYADSSATSIIFMATGVGLQLSVIDPNGAVVTPVTQFQLGNAYGWYLANPVVGQYLLQLSSSQSDSPCSYRILARSNYDFFYSSSPGLIFDAGFSEPVYNNARHIVAVFNGEPIIDPYRQFAEITIYGNDDNDVRQSLYMSSGTYRSGCTYKMYFGAYNCRTPERLLYITVSTSSTCISFKR
uniref:EGF-like domain-containing protein n=1 Tax=Plectus sambesii TaxID=2011161 RepID=A0A914WIG2_9BILA